MGINKYGLLDIELEEIISIFRNNNKISKLVLFGSRAKGNYSKGSDIDLSIFGNNINTNDILNLLIELEQLEFPYKFDVVNYHRISESDLIQHIDRVGIILFEKSV